MTFRRGVVLNEEEKMNVLMVTTGRNYECNRRSSLYRLTEFNRKCTAVTIGLTIE